MRDRHQKWTGVKWGSKEKGTSNFSGEKEEKTPSKKFSFQGGEKSLTRTDNKALGSKKSGHQKRPRGRLKPWKRVGSPAPKETIGKTTQRGREKKNREVQGGGGAST